MDFLSDLMNFLGNVTIDGRFTNFVVLVVLVVFGFCFIALFMRRKAWAKGLVTNATTLITSTGIFFTFFGIFVGLQGFNTNQIDQSIEQLLGGMKIAFLSSVLGLGLALLFRVLRIVIFSNSGGVSSETNATDIHNALRDNNEIIQKGFADLSDALGGEGDTSVASQLSKLRTLTSDKLDSLTEEFRKFAETIAENNSKALIEALEGVMRDFNAKINEQFGDNFKQLNEAVGKLVEWQENYRQQMEELLEAFKTTRDNIKEIENSLSNVETSTSKIPDHLESLEGVYTKLTSQIDDLSDTLESFADMRESAKNAFPTIQAGLVDFTQNLSQNITQMTEGLEQGISVSLSKVEEVSETHRQALDATQESVTEISRLSQESIENSNKVSETGLELVTETASSLDNAIQQHNERVLKMIESQDEEYKKLVKGLAEGLEQGISVSLSKVEEVSETHRQALDATKESVTEISRLSQESIENSKEISKLGEDLVTETASSLETAIQQHNKRVLKMIESQDEEYKKLVKGLTDGMRKGIEDGVGELGNAVSDLDSEMQEEVKRVVKVMGDNITAITDEFVKQYQRLVDSTKNNDK